MSTVYRGDPGATKVMPESTVGCVLVKGAPESVLGRCVGQPDPRQGDRLFAPLARWTDQDRHDAGHCAVAMAERGLRVLAMAYRLVQSAADLSELATKDDDDVDVRAERDLCFAGLVGLADPPRPQVHDAVAECQAAGIRVVMITGDHLVTARAIAEQLGIVDPSDPARSRTMRGAELGVVSANVLAKMEPFPVVFARVRCVLAVAS